MSWTRLSDFTFTFPFHALEKEMATHSSVLAWRIPGMGEPGGPPSMGSHTVGHDWSDLAVLSSIVAAPVYTPTNHVGGFLSSTPSPTFIICRYVYDGPSEQCEVTPPCSFDLHFQIMWNIFSCVLWQSVRRLWRNVCLGLLSIFWLDCLIKLYELFVYFGN